MKLLPPFCIATALILSLQPVAAQDWRTDYEKSGYRESPRFEATIAYIKRLEKASPWIRVQGFGTTPQGRELPLVILSSEKAFTPSAARALDKPVVLIQSGIHAGEIDGKDASLMLMREIAVTKTLQHLAKSVTILFMPIFNLDGHERQSPYNRINQNGPEEMGWRTTAQNLNLNRDFLKADAPEMRAWLKVYNDWLPDLLIDCHVTNGIDFQYNLTYSMEMFGNAPPPVVQWQKALEKAMIEGMAAQGDPIFPYVFPRENNDLSKGLLSYAAPPRFSTGYATIRNRSALLVETHMLKSYKDRVTATYRLLVEILKFIGNDPSSLRIAVKRADEETVSTFSSVRPGSYPLRFASSDKARDVRFLGYETELRKSDISGASHPVWHHNKPVTATIPFFDDVQPVLSITPPLFYVVPQEWTAVLDVLRVHGVHLRPLSQPVTLRVESYVFATPKWREQPYEGRHILTDVKHMTRLDTIAYPSGTFVVPLDQHAAKVAVHLLEPDGPDSFVAWGFFNAVFELKEYFEDYVIEEIASKMLRNDAELKAAFESRLASDSTFAKNPRSRLNFFYERSPYRDTKQNIYPVGRIMEMQPGLKN